MTVLLDRPAPLPVDVPTGQEAGEPAEARGLARDEVALMVAQRGNGCLVHTRFRELPEHLRAGDLLVINTSKTVPAAVSGVLPDGRRVLVHVSGRLPGARWLVELRQPREAASEPLWEGETGWTVELPGGGRARLIDPRRPRSPSGDPRPVRLWEAELSLPDDPLAYLERYGRPIRYGYVRRGWPIEAYRTIYATEPGSAEMPSAGRGFTPELVTRLVARGILIAPVVLHTGVSSPEGDEPPYVEWFRVPPTTARLVNAIRQWGGRVIAVGTTAVRALESAAGPDGSVSPAEGWTDLVVDPGRGVLAIDGLLTGWHRPEATHLLLLEAVAGRLLLEASYREAVARGYRWHEFGDLHLILP